MKRIKLLFLTMLIITMCTGCSIEYDITITKDNINEIISVNDYITSSRTESEILEHYNMWYPVFVNYIEEGETIELEDYTEKADGIKYYEKNINKIYNGYNYTYKYNYDIRDYYDSYALATTFLKTTVQKRGNSLVLTSSKENLLCNYEEFNSLKVNITIDPEVYQINYTNASNINKNTYTWNLNRSNCDDSEIILTLDTINNDEPVKNENKNTYSQYTLYIFCGVIILLILIGYFIFKRLKDKNNDFNEDD